MRLRQRFSLWWLYVRVWYQHERLIREVMRGVGVPRSEAILIIEQLRTQLQTLGAAEFQRQFVKYGARSGRRSLPN